MKEICVYTEEALRKKDSCTFLSIENHDDILRHISKQWLKHNFFSEYEMTYPKIILSIKWKYD